MKKMLCWACLLMALALLPALAMAEGMPGASSRMEAAGGAAGPIDWTALVVAVIGVIGTAVSALLGRVWVKYVRPWLEQRDLMDAAKIVVESVEALAGRYMGEEKWKMALDRMAARGFNIDSDAVIDALKAEWKRLDLDMMIAGEKKAKEAIADESD